MALAEEILDFRDVFSSAQVLITLHGDAAWFVADKRSNDCFEWGQQVEGIAWDHIKLVIAEMRAKAKLAASQVH